MVVPVRDQAAQKIGPAQQWAICGCAATQGDVATAAGATVAAVEIELLRRKAHLPGFVIERGGHLAQIAPRGRGMDVHLDHARIGCQLEFRET